MNVDVSPDGSELLFDLLGDIYTVPSTVRGAMAPVDGCVVVLIRLTYAMVRLHD
jgi:hypothetical protein